MKKINYLIICLLLLSGCSNKKENTVKTIIDNQNNILVAINYPQFGYNKMDSSIDKYINTVYRNFQNEFSNKSGFKNQAELNIDYIHNTLNNRYINVVMKKFVNQSNLAHPYNEMETFHYDKNKNKLFSLDYIISKEELIKLIPLIKKEIITKYKECVLPEALNSYINDDFSHYRNFSFDDDNLTIYFEPYLVTAGYCNIISIDLSLDKVNLKIPLERGVFNEMKNEKIIPEYHQADPTKPMIALTFDDGPSSYTRDIVKLLKEYDAVATFFVIGNKVSMYDKTIKLLYKNGNELGNHSYNHKWLTRVTDDELVEQINMTQNIVNELTGFTPKLFRPTYGSINKHLREKVKLDIIMWDVDTSDWKTRNAKKIATRAINSIKDGNIILMHDTHKQTYEALKYMLPVLKKKGYQFVTVSELKEIATIKQSSTTQ